MLTSLGTMTPLPVNGTAGWPASTDDVSVEVGLWGAGAVVAFGAHAASHTAAGARTSHRPIDLIAILPMWIRRAAKDRVTPSSEGAETSRSGPS